MANSNNIERLKGTWHYVSGENFDELLQELGANQITRTVLDTVKPDVIIDENDGKWSLTNQSLSRASTMEFTPGVEFEHVSRLGHDITVIIQFENGKWVQKVHYDDDGKDVYIERWINDKDQLQVTMKTGNIEATQLYERAN